MRFRRSVLLWILFLLFSFSLTACGFQTRPTVNESSVPSSPYPTFTLPPPASGTRAAPAAAAPLTSPAPSPESGRATATAAPDDAVVLAAGDVAVCGSNQDEATAQLLVNTPGAPVLMLGDSVYEIGTTAQFTDCYAPSWGRVRDRTHPVPGNHDYAAPEASGYYRYFGAAAGPAGKGYYSFDVGAWHLIALNSEIAVQSGSVQEQWLRADLAAHHNLCTLAYWHKPRFSSGPHGSDALYQPFWQALYRAGADLVLNGHDHDYERFAPQTPDGQADPARGLREFVVGTGGATLYPFPFVVSNSEARGNDTWGVLKLVLHADSYDWQFLRAAGGSFTDSGRGACHP